MKILYTPLMIVPALDDTDRKNILEAAGPGSTLIEAKDPAVQRQEIGDTEALFGRVANDLFVTAKRLRYYHSIGAGVDAILTPELVNSDVILASEKGEVGIHLAEHAFALLAHDHARHPHRAAQAGLQPARAHPERAVGAARPDAGDRRLRRHRPRRRAARAWLRHEGAGGRHRRRAGHGGVTLWKSDRLNDLLGQSDVVVICLPLTKATRHMFSRDLFRRMRRHAILVNVTRGAIVFGDDLLAALDEGLIGGVGLDVTDPEPLPAGHRLWTHPRAVVTPHTAGGSPRRAGRVIATFCENLRRLRTGQPLLALIDKQKGY